MVDDKALDNKALGDKALGDKALTPVEQRTVVFYDDEIPAAVVVGHESERPNIYVPIRPLCDFLGVNYRAQRRRIDRDPVLANVVTEVQLATAGGPQAMPCLHLDYLNGWLFGISAASVKEEIRERVIRYQKECYQALRDAFQEPRVMDQLTQVEQLGHALITLAREQREFDRRLSSTEEELADVRQRVVAIEERVAPGEAVTEEQASQISQAVKAVAIALSKETGRNEFGGVYGQLYRKFGITSYKLLPAARFQEAMAFLTEWFRSIGDSPDEPPF